MEDVIIFPAGPLEYLLHVVLPFSRSSPPCLTRGVITPPEWRQRMPGEMNGPSYQSNFPDVVTANRRGPLFSIARVPWDPICAK
jgi:hypothetical protein